MLKGDEYADHPLNFASVNMRRWPNYAPYCGRCPGMVRMRRVSPLRAECVVRGCGAVHEIVQEQSDD